MNLPDRSNFAHFRATARQTVSLPGALRAQEMDWNRDVRVVDLGLGGACVEVSDSVPAGTAVELVIDAPHLWDPLTLTGTVAWSLTSVDPDGGMGTLGVRFEHAKGGSVRTLTGLLEAEGFG